VLSKYALATVEHGTMRIMYQASTAVPEVYCVTEVTADERHTQLNKRLLNYDRQTDILLILVQLSVIH